MIRQCFHCGGYKADVKKGSDWYHARCWETMPPNAVFPKEFRRFTAQMALDKALKPYIKNNKLIL